LAERGPGLGEDLLEDVEALGEAAHILSEIDILSSCDLLSDNLRPVTGTFLGV
jgi:hypothetical protein